MTESLRRLVNIGSFRILQEKLEKWSDDYNYNTCDQNVARACEIIELNARVQGQLFKLLSLCASDGGLYGGAAIIRNRLLPLLGHAFFASGLSSDASLSILAEAASKSHEVSDIKQAYESSLDDLDAELKKSQSENEELRAELEDTKVELDREKRSSTSDKMFNESEIRDLKFKLSQAESDNDRLRSRLTSVDDCDRQIRSLRDEVNYLQSKKDLMSPPLPRYSPAPPPPPPQSAFSKVADVKLADSIAAHSFHGRPPVSPLSFHDPFQRSRQQSLIARFNDSFSVTRLDAMDILRRYLDDHENNQRILFTAVQEAFTAAKIAFRSFKSKVRSQLLLTHLGPDTLEEAVQDFINCHPDHADIPAIVQDVMRALNRNYRLYLPPGVSFEVIHSFVKEAARLAWDMSCLAHPIDISSANDSELFDEQKYRRSYDSEYTAPLVNHHIWPCLIQDTTILMKGEACTRRGSSSYRPRSSSRTGRSASPGRPTTPSRSPIASARGRTPRSGRAKSPDPLSTTRTASTSLSHYM